MRQADALTKNKTKWLLAQAPSCEVSTKNLFHTHRHCDKETLPRKLMFMCRVDSNLEILKMVIGDKAFNLSSYFWTAGSLVTPLIAVKHYSIEKLLLISYYRNTK